MHYHVVFCDDSWLDLKTLATDRDDRPSRGVSVENVPIIVGSYKFIAIYPDGDEVIDAKKAIWSGF